MADASEGALRIRWVEENMPLLAGIRTGFRRRRPFDGLTIGVSLHLEPKTAALLNTLHEGGAAIVATGNLGTTQDEVVAAMRDTGIEAIGRRDDGVEQHMANVAEVAAARPDIILDNGADLAATCAADDVIGGTEETTSGANRLRGELAGRVPYPVIVINDSPLKAIVENQHAVGQSVIESFQRITNLMIQGKRIAVFGYGWCGRGIAHYARELGAAVTVVEPDPIKALEAAMAAYRVAEPEEAIEWATVLITATGAVGVLGPEHVELLRPEVLLVNAGHFPDEIDVPGIVALAVDRATIAPGVERLRFAGGHTARLLTGGRMVNLSGPNPKGNSIESMDLGFSLQAATLERVATDRSGLVPGPQPVPDDINATLARGFVLLLGGSPSTADGQ